MRPLLNSAMHTKNLFLIRDPRDQFVSLQQFNAKRGNRDLGKQENKSDQEFARLLVKRNRRTMRELLDHEQNNRNIHLRYEDIVLDTESEVRRLETFLDVEFDMAAIMQSSTKLDAHGTSRSPQDSIGRWKRLMSPEIKDIFKQEMSDELATFGYD